MRLMRALYRVIRGDEIAATAIEYAFVGLLISIAAFSVLVSIGNSISGVFSTVAGKL
jgi:Flp pilus assembly pilin Flp